MIDEDFGELARSRLGLGFKGIQPEWNTFKTVEQSKRQMNLHADSVIFSQKNVNSTFPKNALNWLQKCKEIMFLPGVTNAKMRRVVTFSKVI